MLQLQYMAGLTFVLFDIPDGVQAGGGGHDGGDGL